MTAREQLFALYKKCYEQRSVLTDATPLTIDVTSLNADSFDYQGAKSEIEKVMQYLLSVRNIQKISIPEALVIVERTYNNQPFWKNLILDYLSFTVQERSEKFTQNAASARQRAEEVLDKIKSKEAEQKAIIAAYSAPLKEQNFAIDGVRLISNYLNMSRKDPKKAWDVLISNPGYFSPIITTDKEGKTILTPEQAKTENKKIAKFLKGLSV